MSSAQKWFAIGLIIIITYGYSMFQKSRLESMLQVETNAEYVLKTFPEVNLGDVYSDVDITKDSLYQNKPDLVFVHFWGTWCAPCEEEFPALVQFIERFRERKVTFLIIAVNDEIQEVKKFLGKFKNLRESSILAFDAKGISLEQFGTSKVPESYLFDRNGGLYKKLIGPQDWANEYFFKLMTENI